MRNVLPYLALAALCACDGARVGENAGPSLLLSPRIERSASVTDSVWTSTAAVHVHLATTSGSTLSDDTVLFSAHRIPVVSAPTDKGVAVSIEGLNDVLAVVWTGSATLPPGGRDTTFLVTVGLATTSGTGRGPSGSKGTMNAPTLDSVSVVATSPDNYDRPVRVYLSCLTPGATIHYTLDGTTPMAFTQTYGENGILIGSTSTLKAVAIRPGWTNSSLLVQTFVIRT